MSKRLLCVWLPNWPVQRIQADEPQLANAPLVLSARDPRRGFIVAAANLAARAEGIRPAMRLSEANALVDSEVRDHDPQEDLDELCSLTEQAQQFSPLVGLEQLDNKPWAGRTLHQPECMVLDITGLAGLFGGEESLIRKVGGWLREQNYFGCMGVASSLGVAWAIANYATRTKVAIEIDVEENKNAQPDISQPDMAVAGRPQSVSAPVPNGSSCPPSRYCLVPAKRDAQFLANLPVAALRIQQGTIESLQRLGIHTVGQLDALPRAGMATRLGPELISRWDQALGIKHEQVVALHSQPEWCLEQILEYPTQHRGTIAELVRRLSLELSQRLSRRGEGALRIVCRIDQSQTQPIIMQLGLFRPTNDAQHIELLLNGQLEQQLRSLGQVPVWRISLQATLTAPMVWRQVDLFDGGEAASRQQMARLVDTLSSRLGRKQVLTAKTKREAQPELAFSLSPMTGRRNDGSLQDTIKKLSSRLSRRRAEPSREDPLRRPTHLMNVPVSIQVKLPSETLAKDCLETTQCELEQPQTKQPEALHPGVAPTKPTQPELRLSQSVRRLATAPTQFWYQGTWRSVVAAHGPERLESGWWRGPSTRRDYYRVATEQGSWWWLYRDLNTGQWYVHGMFD